jgi:hypothetical protein
MGIKRTKGSHQKGKKPLLINHLKVLIEVIDKSKEKIKKFRDRAIILNWFFRRF